MAATFVVVLLAGVLGGVAIAADGDVFYACEKNGKVSNVMLNQEPNCKRGATVVSWADGVDGADGAVGPAGPPGPAGGVAVQYVNANVPIPAATAETPLVVVQAIASCPDGTVVVGGGYHLGVHDRRELPNIHVWNAQLNYPDAKYQVILDSTSTATGDDLQVTAACVVGTLTP